MRRRKWIKRSLLAVALVLTAAAAWSYWAFTGTPAYYVRPELTEQERTDAANRAIEKFRQGREWANDIWVREQRSLLAAGRPAATNAAATTGPATSPASPDRSLTITFTARELNAFSDEWAASWEQRYRETLKDPFIVLQDDRIILAAEMTELGTVVSFHFYPRVEQGQLLLTLESVRAGRLPVPEVFWAAQRDRVVAGLRRRLPGWQGDARIEPNGVANADAVAAHMSKLLFDVLARRPHESVLFIPFDEDGRAVPVRLTAIDVAEGKLTLTVEPLSAEERYALLERIRQPVGAAVASAE